jgi:ketosteroid isomerase-like protein
MDSTAAQATVEAYFRALGEANEDEFGALFTDDAWFCDPIGGKPGVAKFLRGMRRAWSTFASTPTRVFVRGNRATAHWTASGRSQTGNDIVFDGIDLFEIADDGRICRVEGYWDIEAVMRQMAPS